MRVFVNDCKYVSVSVSSFVHEVVFVVYLVNPRVFVCICVTDVYRGGQLVHITRLQGIAAQHPPSPPRVACPCSNSCAVSSHQVTRSRRRSPRGEAAVLQTFTCLQRLSWSVFLPHVFFGSMISRRTDFCRCDRWKATWRWMFCAETVPAVFLFKVLKKCPLKQCYGLPLTQEKQNKRGASIKKKKPGFTFLCPFVPLSLPPPRSTT